MGCFPSQGPHGKVVIIPAVVHLELCRKVLKGIEKMGRIKPFVILPVAAFYFTIMPGSKGTNEFMPYAMCFQMFLEERRLFPMGSKTVCEFRPIVCLDAFNGTGKCLYKVFHELRRRIRIVFLKGFYKTPSGILIDSCILEEVLPNDVTVFETGRGDKFDVYLNPLTGMIHLLIRFRGILGIWGMDGHHVLFSEETVKARDRAGIAPLPKFDPEDDKTGMRIAFAHIPDEFDFLRGMLV